MRDLREQLADEFAAFLRQEGGAHRPYDFADGALVLIENHLDALTERAEKAETDRDAALVDAKASSDANAFLRDAAQRHNARAEKAEAEVARVRAQVAEEIAAAIRNHIESFEAPEYWQEAIDALKDAAEIASEHAKGDPDEPAP